MIIVPIKETLIKFVKESNKIENMTVRANQHLFVDHLFAANFVVDKAKNEKMATPEEIHKILMKRVGQQNYRITFVPGEFRKVFVRVGPYLKPDPKIVPTLIKKWNKNVERFLKTADSITLEEKENISWYYHYWFEAIHPFLDGNGRSGRLVLNNIRLLIGLPWLIVDSEKKWEYFEKIRDWEIENEHLLLMP